MQLEKIPLADTQSFSPFFLDYINETPALKPFYGYFPNVENFEKQIEARTSFSPVIRKVLSSVLTRQYQSVEKSLLVEMNIKALESPDSFTVVTGHQQNIVTGPLYFINKIVTTINICRVLTQKYPEKKFIPVYWMASEDHDFEEISYFRLYGKKYVWKTQQQGAVGKFDPKGLEEVLKDVPGNTDLFKKAYKQKTLSDAVRYYVNSLFGDQGLVVIDGDDHELKGSFTHVMKDDITNNIVRSLVEADTSKLQALGYHTQVNAREINFFYLAAGLRERIEKDGDGYRVVDHDIRWSKTEIVQLITREPEKFSPNVILRPLYQETILPNLAYVGGPSEVVYWLQLKSVFTHFEVPFPILMPRNFSMIMESAVYRKFEKTGLETKDLFEDKNYLFNHWTLKNSNKKLSVDTFAETIQKAFDEIRGQGKEIDPTLIPHIEAKKKQVNNILENIERKMLRAEKRRLSDKLSQIEAVKDLLFPGGSLQERTDNFLNFFQSNPDFIADLLNCFDPFDYRLHVLIYND